MDPDTALVLEDIRQILANSEHLKKKFDKPKPRKNPLAYVDPALVDDKSQASTQHPKRKRKMKPPARIPSLAPSNLSESKEDKDIRALTLPYVESALLVTQSFDVVNKYGYAQRIGKPAEKSPDKLLSDLMKRYPRYCYGLNPPSMEIDFYRVRNDQWVARLIEECYDAASAECCKPVSEQRTRRRFELDLGAMDAFPLVVRRHIKLLYSTMEHESIVCLEFIIAIDKVLKRMESVGINRKIDGALVSNSGRVELFSSFLAEELEVDRLAVFLHTRDFTQQMLGVNFRELYVSLKVDTALPVVSPEIVELPNKKQKKGKKNKDNNKLGTTTLLQGHLFLDPVEFEGDMDDLQNRTRDGDIIIPGEGKVVPPSLSLPFFLRLSKDACMPEAPLLALDMRTLKVLCQNLTPDCSEEVRNYMIKRCLFWTDILCKFKGSMFKVWQELKNIGSFHDCEYKGLFVDGLKVVPAYVFLWMICTEMGSYADVAEQIVATDTGVSDDTTTEQSIAMLNNVYDQDRAREKAMEAAIQVEVLELSHCNAHLRKLEKKKRQIERKWKEYDPDLTLRGLQVKQAEANKGFSVFDVTDLSAEITEFEGLKSTLESKIKRMKKNKKKYLEDVENLWEVALKGKRKFQDLKPIKTRKQVKAIKGTTNTKWRDVAIEKIIHAMTRNVQMTEVERAAQLDMADTISRTASLVSDESKSKVDVEADSNEKYINMLGQFDKDLAEDNSTIVTEDDTAALVRELEKEAKELAALGQDVNSDLKDVSSLESKEETIIDMDNYDTQHVEIDCASEEKSLEREEQHSLDSQRLSLVSREAEVFVENILRHPIALPDPGDIPAVGKKEDLSLVDLEIPSAQVSPREELADFHEQRKELASREAGAFVHDLLSPSLFSSIQRQEELGTHSTFEYVQAEVRDKIERRDSQRLRSRLQIWIFATNRRRFNRMQNDQMLQERTRNVIRYLDALRREKQQRRSMKLVNDQNLKYYLFIKSQFRMKAGVVALQNSVSLKRDLIERNNARLGKMVGIFHFKMRQGLIGMVENAGRRSYERDCYKRARRKYNSKLFKMRNTSLMEWLVWTKKILYLKHTACIKIQLCIRRFLAVRRVQQCRLAAKVRENAMVECAKLGDTKMLRKALHRFKCWKQKYSRLRQCRELVKMNSTRSILKTWLQVYAALRISRTIRAFEGRKRSRMKRLRLVRSAELCNGFPVIHGLNLQKKALMKWRRFSGCEMFLRRFLRYAMLTKVAMRFAHWKNMWVEYNKYINQHATVINSLARMVISKRTVVDFHVVRQGVLAFQCVVRSRFAQEVVSYLRYRMNCATAIQKVFRGYSCRKGLRQRRIDDIHDAATNNKYERLKYYCERYFNLTFQPDAEGNYPLHNAAKTAAKRCIKLLIKFHHDPTLTNSDGNTPLHLLIMSSAIHRDSVFEYMLEIGFDEEQFTADGKSALVLACEYGRTRIVNLCLEHGLNPNQPDSYNTTCLQYAIFGDFVPLVRTLLQYEADSNQAGYEGMSPLHDVAGTGNLEIAKILIEESRMETEIDINIQDQGFGYTPVMVAARSGFDEMVSYFCSLYCSIELLDFNNWAAQHHCALANNANTVNHLREMVADFDLVDFNGNTPMHVAAENGNHLTLKEILSLGAMPSPQNYEGNQPAHLAAMNNHVNCLNYLVRYDEHIGRVNYKHQTPLGMAKFHVSEEARRFLEEWFTKVAGPETRNPLGDIWWDEKLDDEVGHWICQTDEANHRIFINTYTGEVSLDPPKLTYDYVKAVAENAQAPMRMKVIQNEEENVINHHVYMEEHSVFKKDIESEVLKYDAATVINKTARRKLAYKLYRRKVKEARRQRVLTNFFLRACHVLAIRRMLRNTRMWRRIQACWRGYIFRCHFYYWDGTYETLWYARARRILARMVWTAYKNYKFRQMQRTLEVAATAPKMLDGWGEILDMLGHPLRVVGIFEEYLYPDTNNIYFYRNSNTGNVVFQKPQEIVDKDLQDHRDRIMLREKGFTKNQERLAKKLQSMWRGYKVRTRFRIIIRAKSICVHAEQKFLDNPDNEQNMFNYTLYVHVVKHDYDRARPLYIEMLRKMTHRGPDIAQILYAYAIFSYVVHDQEFEEAVSLVERARVAEEKQYNYLRRQKLKSVDMLAYENYKDISVTPGSSFELAHIGFFHHTTTQIQKSESYHNYAASAFLIYGDFEKAFDAYLKAFQLDPFNSKCRMNYNSMMAFVCGDNSEKVDKVAMSRMQVIGEKDHKRRMQIDKARAEAFHRQRCAVRIQRWYSHHKGLREYYKFVDKLRRKKRRAGLIK